VILITGPLPGTPEFRAYLRDRSHPAQFEDWPVCCTFRDVFTGREVSPGMSPRFLHQDGALVALQLGDEILVVDEGACKCREAVG
jgi:hypothetical protein